MTGMQAVRTRLVSLAPSLLFVCIAAAVLRAQTTPSKADPQEALRDRPTFRVAIDLVTTDVIVRDARGQFVSDLTKDDFEIFEDGDRQLLSSMVLVHGGRTMNVLIPPPPPVQEGIILPPQRPTNDAAGRIFVLFVDDLHLDFQNTPRIRDLFKRIARVLIHEGDLFGIISTGPSSLSIDLSYDRSRIDEAIKKISGSGLKPTEVIQGAQGSQGPTEVRYRAHVAFSTMYDILRNLETVRDRRKAIIYVSDGYDFNPFEKARFGEDPDDYFERRWGTERNQTDDTGAQNDPTTTRNRMGEQFADTDLVLELAEVTRAANRANATIYTIDPRGLVGGVDIADNVDPQEWFTYVSKTQDSLRVLAEETGGIAVVNQNDFDKGLKRIDAETSDYYVLGYYSKNPDPLRRTRAIEVRTRRPDLSVWSRKSYTLKPAPAPVSPTR